MQTTESDAILPLELLLATFSHLSLKEQYRTRQLSSLYANVQPVLTLQHFVETFGVYPATIHTTTGKYVADLGFVSLNLVDGTKCQFIIDLVDYNARSVKQLLNKNIIRIPTSYGTFYLVQSKHRTRPYTRLNKVRLDATLAQLTALQTSGVPVQKFKFMQIHLKTMNPANVDFTIDYNNNHFKNTLTWTSREPAFSATLVRNTYI